MTEHVQQRHHMREWPLCEYAEYVGHIQTMLQLEREMALRLKEASAGTVLEHYWAICAQRADHTLHLHGQPLPAPCARAIREEKQLRQQSSEEASCPNLS